MSDSLPNSGTVVVEVSINEATSQGSSGSPCNWPTIVGMAVPTILASSAESAVASITAMTTSSLWLCGWGVPPAGAVEVDATALSGSGGAMVEVDRLDTKNGTLPVVIWVSV